MFETRPSPTVSVTSPEGRNLPTSSPRRGLSKLRSLTQSRLQSSTGAPSESPRPSPRHYFARSVSYNERPSTADGSSRPRSSSRPTDNRLEAQPSLPEPRRTRSTSRSRGVEDSADLMARHRTSNATRGATDSSHSTEAQRSGRLAEDRASERSAVNNRTSSGNDPSTTVAGEANDTSETKPPLPTIRFFPHQEVRNGRQSLPFTPITRTLPSESSIIRVGRYSEREGIPTTNPTIPSDAPVGFKSKVVSRKHCEFSFAEGQWQVKDVCSSSGTFLNHIRLSQPNMESKLFPVKDGDIVQLGIDFRGGEEMIFRCVKIRIECNRSWQKRPNNFNMNRHAQLQSLGKSEATTQENSGECAICLGAVLPCQSLFVAACAHVWHYKCIRPMLEGKNSSYPHFQCPNCRAWTDLSAEVDVPEDVMDEWMENAGDAQAPAQAKESAATVPNNDSRTEEYTARVDSGGANDNGRTEVDQEMGTIEEDTESHGGVQLTSQAGLLARRQASHPASPEIASVNVINIPGQPMPSTTDITHVDRKDTTTPEHGEVLSGEGPLTPRNNAGPFVFDGSAGRSSGHQGVPPLANSSQ